MQKRLPYEQNTTQYNVFEVDVVNYPEAYFPLREVMINEKKYKFYKVQEAHGYMPTVIGIPANYSEVDVDIGRAGKRKSYAYEKGGPSFQAACDICDEIYGIDFPEEDLFF